jgi:hypothetical protein
LYAAIVFTEFVKVFVIPEIVSELTNPETE